MSKDVVESQAIVAERTGRAIGTDAVELIVRNASDATRAALLVDSACTSLRKETGFDCPERGEPSIAQTAYFTLSPGNNGNSSKVTILETPSKLDTRSSAHCLSFVWPSSTRASSSESTTVMAHSSDPAHGNDSRADGSRASSTCERSSARLFSPGSLEASYAGLGGTTNFSASVSTTSAVVSCSSTANPNQVPATAAVAMPEAADSLVNSSDYKLRIDETYTNSNKNTALSPARQTCCGSKLGVSAVRTPPPSPPTPPSGLAPALPPDDVLPLTTLATSASFMNATSTLEARLKALREVASRTEIQAPWATFKSNDSTDSLAAIEAENRSLREDLSIMSDSSQTKNAELEKRCQTMEGECEHLRATVAELERRLRLCETMQQKSIASESSVPCRLNASTENDITTSSFVTTGDALPLVPTSSPNKVGAFADDSSAVASRSSLPFSSSYNVDSQLSHANRSEFTLQPSTLQEVEPLESVKAVASIADKQPPLIASAKESIDTHEIGTTSAPLKKYGHGDPFSAPALSPPASNKSLGVEYGAFAVPPLPTCPLMSASLISCNKSSAATRWNSTIGHRSAEWKMGSSATRATSSGTSSTIPSTVNFSPASLNGNAMLNNSSSLHPTRESGSFRIGTRSISPCPTIRSGHASLAGSSRKTIRSAIGSDLGNLSPSRSRPPFSTTSSSKNTPQRLTANLDVTLALPTAQRSSLFDNLAVTPRREATSQRPVSARRSDALVLSSKNLDDSTASVFNQSQAMPSPASRYSMLRICENLPRQLYSRRSL